MLRSFRLARACLSLKTTKHFLKTPYRFVHQPISWQRSAFHTTRPWFEEQQDNAFKRQMLIGFTCTVCEERSHHTMSKHAYTKGVVLIQCPGCKNRHLIADNLGWFKDSRTTVEDLVKEKGEAIRKVFVDEQGVERLGDLMEWLPEITEEERIKLERQKK
ncbi:Uncharacterized protein C24H6.02c [Choanephora cucurbitarum]|uniref:Uncharacterized protein C24H6.02c n=1 Tax=Choanephora cucurbitarum TaxID=101091 RepID=A0A1C7NFE9_9FUNG|nr:Uncharacterized protein C24H6.02c [Choanephora cucurbitarum]